MVARDLYEAYALNDIPKEGYIVSGYFNCTDNHIIYKIFTYSDLKSINNKDGVITITADKVIIETYDAYSKKKIDKSTAETGACQVICRRKTDVRRRNAFIDCKSESAGKGEQNQADQQQAKGKPDVKG